MFNAKSWNIALDIVHHPINLKKIKGIAISESKVDFFIVKRRYWRIFEFLISH